MDVRRELLGAAEVLGRTAQAYGAADPVRSGLAAVANLEVMTSRLAGVQAVYVERVRARGASWAQVGDALGITKQAAQQRFTRREASRG